MPRWVTQPMATESLRPGVRTISLDELPEVIAQAKAESWQKLALIGPKMLAAYEASGFDDWPTEHIFRLSADMTDTSPLTSLTELQSLDLNGNEIGDEGVRPLASLTGLKSLDLILNHIGAEGTRALASLTGLTSLGLHMNRIGDEGARALASLTGLTSLGLGVNQIGTDGAHSGGMSIVVGDGASFVFADQINDPARVSQGGSMQRSSSEPDPAPTGLAALGAWPYFSAAGGVAAMLVAVLLWMLPSNEWRAAVGGLLAIGLGATAWLLRLNPRWYYRRWLSVVIPAGLLINALGVTAEIIYQDPQRAGGFRWDSAVSGWFFAAWAVVIIALIAADGWQNPGSRQR
jgi:hypothetical protein